MGALLLVGQAVTVRAADDFYAFIDGWRGTVYSYEAGSVWIECVRQGVTLRFLVPADQLEAVRA